MDYKSFHADVHPPKFNSSIREATPTQSYFQHQPVATATIDSWRPPPVAATVVVVPRETPAWSPFAANDEGAVISGTSVVSYIRSPRYNTTTPAVCTVNPEIVPFCTNQPSDTTQHAKQSIYYFEAFPPHATRLIAQAAFRT